MRKSLVIILCIIIAFGFVGCGSSKSDVVVPTSQGSTIKLDGNVLTSQVGFSITFPKNWEGRWTSQFQASGVAIYCRAIQEATAQGGELFSVSRYLGKPQGEGNYGTPTYELGEYNGYTYVFNLPSDMQWLTTNDEKGAELEAEYKSMTKDFADIRKNIKLGDYASSGSIELSSKWNDIYVYTLYSYMKQDIALNDNIDFIAIDLGTLEYANDYDKKTVLNWFTNQYKPARDASLDDLKVEGLYDESSMSIPNGLLLKINKVTEGEKEIVIEGEKYRSGLGADKFETKWQLIDGVWKLMGTNMTAIS